MKYPVANTCFALVWAPCLAALALGCDPERYLVGLSDGGTAGAPSTSPGPTGTGGPPGSSPSGQPSSPSLEPPTTTTPSQPSGAPPVSSAPSPPPPASSPVVDACGVKVAAVPPRPLQISGIEAARRVSIFLWGTDPGHDSSQSVPVTNKDVGELARAKLADPRSRLTVIAFFRKWIDLDSTLSWPQGRTPSGPDELDAALYLRMLTEMDRFTAGVVFGPVPTFSALLASGHVFEDEGLRKTYGTPAGILTQPSFLAAHPRATFRGIELLDAFACQQMPQPPNVDVMQVGQAMGRTFRERLQEVTSDPACSACHSLSDPAGFALESFDDLGRFRTEDNGQPIDDSGLWKGTSVDGAVALAAAIDRSCEARLCLASSWLGFATKRAPLDGPLWEPFGPEHPSAREVAGAFQAAGSDLRALIVAMVESEAFLAP